MKRHKIDLASMIMFIACAYAAIFAPNGTNPVCKELWCIVMVKSFFGLMAYAFFETCFFYGAPLQRLTCRLLFGKKNYNDYMNLCKDDIGVFPTKNKE